MYNSSQRRGIQVVFGALKKLPALERVVLTPSTKECLKPSPEKVRTIKMWIKERAEKDVMVVDTLGKVLA